MADAFLHQLFQMENMVPYNRDLCPICHELYGSISPETGTMECAVRLPYNNIVGSACTVKWLSPKAHAKKSCPHCRREFFPAQEASHTESEDGPEQEASTHEHGPAGRGNYIDVVVDTVETERFSVRVGNYSSEMVLVRLHIYRARRSHQDTANLREDYPDEVVTKGLFRTFSAGCAATVCIFMGFVFIRRHFGIWHS